MGMISNPSGVPVPPAAISRVLGRFSRVELEGFISIAIELLDLADGDPDLEEDDHGGGDVCDEPHDANEHFMMTPRYGIDQSAGIVNDVNIIRDYHRRLEAEHESNRD